MKFNDKYNVSSEFESLFTHKNEKEELEHDARMIMYRFLSEIENIENSGNPIKKNELAKKLKVSPSFITQLFNGDKLMNFTLLAKIQDAFNITFEIKARSNDSVYSVDNINLNSFPQPSNVPDGFMVWHKFKPNYDVKDNCCDSDTPDKNSDNNIAA